MSLVPPHPAKPPERVTRDGRFARVEPLDAAKHGADLWSGGLADPAVWTYLAYGPFETETAFQDWLATRDHLADPLYFAIRDQTSGKVLGCATLMEIRPANGVIEVGHIFFSPAMQKTPIATEAIFLLMRYAFEDLGNRRFEWKCDNGNAPSKRAAQRFGFTPEGLFRQHMIVKGRNRDTAWFSILDSEWPVLKGAYEAWLAPENFDGEGTQRKSLGSLIAAAPRMIPGFPDLRLATPDDRAAIEALQADAYAVMWQATGDKPIPLSWDYGAILRDWDVYLSEDSEGLTGALMLHLRPDDLYLESISVAPRLLGTGLGSRLLAATDAAAVASGRSAIRLLTNEKNVDRIALYARKGYAVERIEDLVDRRVVYMVKHLPQG